MAKVSIIVPVHNAEKYLSEAIESILNQTYADFEVLLINDMSTDKSKDICIEYMKNDNRIIVLDNNTRNHGPGPTRNIGLECATGEYIYFMDADDWIENNLLHCAIERMEETKADIVQFGAIYETNDGSYLGQYFWKGKDVFTKEEIKKDFFNFWKDNRNSLWLYAFKAETAKAIRFENIIIGEDVSYVMDILANAERIAYIAKTLYHYRYVEGSTSHCWVENTIDCREIIWNHQRDFIKSFKGDIDKLLYAEVAYDNYIWAIYQLSSILCPLSYRQKRRELLRLEKEMNFDKYRQIYPLELKHGVEKLKYMLVKYRMERIMLLFGPLFLRIVSGE